jgi:hypothetical protein
MIRYQEMLRQANVVYEGVIRKEKDLGQYASNEIALVEFILAGIEYGQKHNLWELKQFVETLYKDSKLKSEQLWLVNEVINNFEKSNKITVMSGADLKPLDKLKEEGLK